MYLNAMRERTPMAAYSLSPRTGTTPAPFTPSVATPSAPRDNEMSLVNLAARQRMLSQRMVLQTVLAAGGSDLHLNSCAQLTSPLHGQPSAAGGHAAPP